MDSKRYFRPGWVWLFPTAYLIHLLDERFYWIGTARFATEYLDIYFTDAAWLWVNLPSLLLVALVSWLVVRGTWPEWLLVALAVHFLAHSLGRLPTSVWHGTIQPGLVSGLLLCAPLGLATLAKGLRVFSRRELTLGFVVGIASIQPLWHFAMLPWLPSPPAVTTSGSTDWAHGLAGQDPEIEPITRNLLSRLSRLSEG